jgi:hypothetical protein
MSHTCDVAAWALVIGASTAITVAAAIVAAAARAPAVRRLILLLMDVDPSWRAATWQWRRWMMDALR